MLLSPQERYCFLPLGHAALPGEILAFAVFRPVFVDPKSLVDKPDFDVYIDVYKTGGRYAVACWNFRSTGGTMLSGESVMGGQTDFLNECRNEFADDSPR